MTTWGVLVFLGGLGLYFLGVVTLYQTRRTRIELHGLAEGIAKAYGNINENMKSIAELPDVMKDLNLGGVQLMPQKPFLQTLVEQWFENRASKDIKTENNEGESWQNAKDPQNPPLEDPVLGE